MQYRSQETNPSWLEWVEKGFRGALCQKHVVESEGKGVQNVHKINDAIWNGDSACYKISRKKV